MILDTSEQSVNQKYYDALAAAGVHAKWSSPQFTYQHAKFIVIDDTAAVISTGNFSKTYSIDLERNFVATDRDPADVADLVSTVRRRLGRQLTADELHAPARLADQRARRASSTSSPARRRR